MITELTAQLTRDEGRERSMYLDHLGYATIGVGRLIDARKGGGLREDEIDYLLRNDINDRIDQLGRRIPWFLELDGARQGEAGAEGIAFHRRDHRQAAAHQGAYGAMAHGHAGAHLQGWLVECGEVAPGTKLLATT